MKKNFKTLSEDDLRLASGGSFVADLKCHEDCGSLGDIQQNSDGDRPYPQSVV